MAEVRLSVQAYARLVTALHSARDPEAMARMATALAPIDAVKQEWKTVRGKNGGEDGAGVLVEIGAAPTNGTSAAPEIT